MNMIDSMLEGSKPEAVEVSDLRKTYGKVIALDGVDLVVTAGTIFGLVGPNGAGKTTLIKALVGALRPTAGAVRVLGLDPLRDKWDLRRQIGYMPQSLALYEDLSARDNILFFSGVHPVDDLPAKVTRILSFTELEDRADDRVATFSGGMKKRISLACALVHEPRTIFLDEPTAAVDPHLRFKMWQFFRRLAGQGTTLVISTHLMDEALLCDRVAVLRRGLIIADDSPAHILEAGRARLAVHFRDRTEQLTIAATPVALATSLLPYGLSPEVDSLVLDFDSLEDVILDIIQTRGEE
jgi:ABC-2 type transport system ATP-binding protein